MLTQQSPDTTRLSFLALKMEPSARKQSIYKKMLILSSWLPWETDTLIVLEESLHVSNRLTMVFQPLHQSGLSTTDRYSSSMYTFKSLLLRIQMKTSELENASFTTIWRMIPSTSLSHVSRMLVSLKVFSLKGISYLFHMISPDITHGQILIWPKISMSMVEFSV